MEFRRDSQCYSDRPNISGSTSWEVNGIGKEGAGYSSVSSSRVSNSGALYVSAGTYFACIGSSGGDLSSNNGVVNISASRSNSIYGGSSVQPPSLALLPCIKFLCKAEGLLMAAEHLTILHKLTKKNELKKSERL